ncbi:MAG: S-layer homology domain-containing protein [Clostridia bacterium]|nr:S-layer homology domain-containing protein [Clostridia bacterium]
MKKRIIAILTLISILCSFVYSPVIFASDKNYSDPVLSPVSDTFIRYYNTTIQEQNEILTVDAGSGNHRIIFLEFNTADYGDYIKDATGVFLNLHVYADGGTVENVNTIRVIPLKDEYKNIDLKTVTYAQASEIIKDGVSLVDYTDDSTVYSAVNYRHIKADVTDYVKSETDTRIVFMVRAVTGAFSVHSKESTEDGSEPSLSIESEYTNTLNSAVSIADCVAQKYDGDYFSDDIDLVTSSDGYSISYVSQSSDYVTSAGEILKRPSAQNGNKKVKLEANVTHTNYPHLCEKSEFEINILSENSISAKSVNVADNKALIEFTTTAPAGSKKIMGIVTKNLLHGQVYSLYCGNEIIKEFTADCTKSHVLIDITDYDATAEFSLFGQLDNDLGAKPVITVLSDEAFEAVMGLYATDLGDLTKVTEDINLPTSFGSYSALWVSSNKAYLSDNGRVERGDVDEAAVLTATLSGTDITFELEYKVKVLRENTDAENNSYPEIKDPMHTSDEELFGKWDIADGSWSVTPLLQYDKFPTLNNVKAAVKQGNYENAKDLLLAYYRTKSGNEVIKFAAENTYDIQATAMLDKIWSFNENDRIVGEVEIGSEWAWHSIDLGKRTTGAYWIMESDMDGSYVEIESKENPGGHSAYVEVIAGGQKYTYPVIDDTYISAGENKDTSYGSEEILLSRESAQGPKMPFGKNTARPYFRFNLGSYSSTVTSVKLNFYARAVGKDSKKVYSLTTVNSSKFEEEDFAWSKQYPNAICFKETGYIWLHENEFRNLWGTEYTWSLWSTRLYQSQWLTSRYLKTLNEDYAYEALDHTMSMYIQQPEGLYPRNLESGWRVEYLLKTMFSTINSEHMTAEIFTALLKWVYAHGYGLKDQYVATANWTSAFKTNFARICAFTPEIAQEGWWEKAKEDLKKFYSGTMLNPDGSYTESCANYIAGVLTEFAAVMEIMVAREDENDEYYIFFKEQLGRLLKYYTVLAYSNGKTPPFGDGARQAPYSGNLEHNEYVNDEALQWILTGGEQGTQPNYTTTYYPDKGMVMFKSGWHNDDLCAFFNNDGGGSHHHYDDLALDVTAYGAFLLVDAGVSTYSAGSEFATVRHDTINHNTIQIDDTNQSAVTRNDAGDTNLITNGSFDYLKAASNDKMYPGFDVGRNVLMLKNKFIVVTDVIKPYDNNPHTYRQLWHPDVNANLTLDSETNLAKTNFSAEPNVKVASVDTGEDAKVFNRMMYSAKTGETYSRSVQYYKENALGTQTFDTVIYPDNTGFDTEIATNRIDLPGVPLEDATAFSLNINDNVGYFYSSNEDVFSERTFDKYTYNGQMAYIETNDEGETVYLAMTNGSKLEDDNIVVEFLSPVSDFSARYESTSLKMYISGNLPAGGVKIASAKKFDSVYLNDKEVEFTYANGYITTTGADKNYNNNQGGLKPGSPSSGGSSFSGGGAATPPPVIPGTTDTTKADYPFSDSENHWAKDYIKKLWSKGIISGVSETQFAPDKTITRAEFTKMIISSCKIPISSADTAFSDVDSTMWYAPYVAAAYNNGFVSGYDDGTFKPDNPITRQEMAKMLCVACDIVKKYDGSNADIFFADNHLISDWAYLYVKKACGLGLFQGDSQNSFNPLNNATRAETAAVICRMLGIQ